MSIRKNRFYYYYRIIKWRVFGDLSPIGASIKITQRCNLRCTHCKWNNDNDTDMPLSEWKRIVDNLYQKGVSVIAVEGGEPMLHPDVSHVVHYIKKKGLYCILITNGTINISHIQPDVFWISIDGMKKCHDSIRGKGTFKKATKTITFNHDKKIISLTSLSKRNIDDMEPLCSYLSPLVSGLMFNFTYPYSGIREETIESNDRRKIAKRLIELKQKYPKILNSRSCLESVGRNKAVYPWLLTTVSGNGNTIQGCMIKHIEQEDCSLCDMGCCSELSMAYELKTDTISFWNKNFGLPRLV